MFCRDLWWWWWDKPRNIQKCGRRTLNYVFSTVYISFESRRHTYVLVRKIFVSLILKAGKVNVLYYNCVRRFKCHRVVNSPMNRIWENLSFRSRKNWNSRINYNLTVELIYKRYTIADSCRQSNVSSWISWLCPGLVGNQRSNVQEW